MSKRVKVENLEQGKVRLTISVSAEEFDNALDKAFEKVVKEVKVDGFRPGKMPKNVFIKRFGWEALYSDALDIVLQETYPVAIHESKVIPVSEPSIDLDFKSLSKGKGFKYTADLEIWEKSELGQYKGLAVKKGAIKVSAAQVKEYINHALASKQETVIKETPAQKGDTVVIDFEGFIDGVAFEGGKGTDYALTIGSHSFIDTFEDQLVGKNVGEEVEVNVTFPAEYHAENLAGKPAMFKVKVNEIKVKELPEADDDFAKDVSEFDTLAEYKEDIKKTLTERAEKEAATKKEDAVVAKAVENATYEIPDAIIDTQARQMAEEFAYRLQAQGLSLEQYFQYTGMDAAKYIETLKPQALKRTETRLVLEAIVKAENITISDEEFEKEATDMAKAYQMELDKFKELISEREKEQIMMDMAVQKAVTLITEAAIEE